MKKIAITLFLSAAFAGCATPKLPDNVAVTPTDGLGRRFITSINYQQKTTLAPDIAYSKAKLCIAEHVTNEGVALEDSSRSFIGAYTGNFYSVNSTQTTQGGQALVIADDSLKTVIARGVIPFKGDDMFGLLHYLKFTLKTKIVADNISIELSQLTEAQQSTGSMPNTGFSPLGAWAGGNAMGANSAAEQLSNALFSCIDH